MRKKSQRRLPHHPAPHILVKVPPHQISGSQSKLIRLLIHREPLSLSHLSKRPKILRRVLQPGILATLSAAIKMEELTSSPRASGGREKPPSGLYCTQTDSRPCQSGRALSQSAHYLPFHFAPHAHLSPRSAKPIPPEPCQPTRAPYYDKRHSPRSQDRAHSRQPQTCRPLRVSIGRTG